MSDPPGFHGVRQGGKQCDPETADHHLNQGVQAASTKVVALVSAAGLADSESLAAQAVAVLQQEVLLAGKTGFGEPLALGEMVAG